VRLQPDVSGARSAGFPALMFRRPGQPPVQIFGDRRQAGSGVMSRCRSWRILSPSGIGSSALTMGGDEVADL